MKIYTKTGDKGQTSLIGGKRVPKYHLRIECYGTIDELNSWIGLIRDQGIDDHSITLLLEIQDRLFTIGSLLAADPDKSNPKTREKIPDLTDNDIAILEKEIDRMVDHLPELRSFILPGGNNTISFCHLARCVCRRAERLIVQLGEESLVDDKVIVYLNRLSDYLFILARWMAQQKNIAETPWSPRL